MRCLRSIDEGAVAMVHSCGHRCRVPLVHLHAERAKEWIRGVGAIEYVRQIRRAQGLAPVDSFWLCSRDEVLRRTVLHHPQSRAESVALPIVVHSTILVQTPPTANRAGDASRPVRSIR